VPRTRPAGVAASPGFAAYNLHPAVPPDRASAERETASREDRIKQKDRLYVAVLTDKGQEDLFLKARVRGDEGILAALENHPGLEAEPITNLRADTLAALFLGMCQF